MSVTAQECLCACGCGGGVKPELLTIANKIRDQFGPMIVSSGFRCKKHNAAVGGVPDSAHTTGEALDIKITNGADRLKFVKVLQANGVSRIGIGHTFVHFDISKTLPQNVMFEYGRGDTVL